MYSWMENKRGDMFTLSIFFFLVQKVPPQLHFVLIMKRWFVFIMTHRVSCHFQQTVLRYNSPSQPVCSHQKTQPLRPPHPTTPPHPTPIFIFCFLSAKHCENPSPLFQVISSQIKQCVTQSKLFSQLWKYLHSVF